MVVAKSLLRYVTEQLEERGHQADPAQLLAVERLQRFHDECVHYKAKRSNPLKKLIYRPDVPKGVYLWGGVGRGKSFVMDCFYHLVPLTRKTRLHFHEFMRRFHADMAECRDQPDPLIAVAERLIDQYRLICFDEFHVSDIADAMILDRLLSHLFAGGVTFVMTSNYPPDGLYPDGLHRDRLLPAIALLNRELDVVQLDGGTDYRRVTLSQVKRYFSPHDETTTPLLSRYFSSLAEAQDESSVLEIESRKIQAIRRAGGVIWFDFATLCGGPRSQNDYLELAKRFHTVILSEVPAMGAGMASEARRFTWLIDILYDHRIQLVMSAAVAPHLLYTEGAMAKEFVRTASRLEEMQSEQYTQQTRRVTS